MSDKNVDLIVVVPTGSRVRYVESRHVEQPVFCDARMLEPPSFGSTFRPMLAGLPLHPADRFTGSVE
jgi:hypothetical protein